MRLSRGYWGVVLVALGLLIVLTPSYISLARASEEVRQLRRQIRQMTSTITITWPDNTTTVFTNCTNYEKSDNGTVSFTGTESGTEPEVESEEVFGHGQYKRISKVNNT